MSENLKVDNWEIEIFPESKDITKTWYVELKYIGPTKHLKGYSGPLRFQKRSNLNRYRKLKDRLFEAEALVKFLRTEIKGGWDPMGLFSREPERENVSFNGLEDMPFNAALDYAFKLKEKTLAKKSKSDIKGVVEMAKAAATKLGMHIMPIKDTRKRHIKRLLNQIAEDRQKVYDKAKPGTKYYKMKFTGNSYNKYRGYLSLVFFELEELEIVELNPCLRISNQGEIETNIHRHPTQKEVGAIKKCLTEVAPDFYTYLAFEVMTGIRPKELFGLQMNDIDNYNQCFDIKATDEKSKTKKARRVPIPNALLPYLEAMELHKYPKDYYVFSEGFKPGEQRKNRDYATKLWKKLIKDGLGINVSLYNFKGYGGELKREAGINTGMVSAGFGHSNINMSLLYLKGEQDRINKEIIEKTPGF